MSLTPPFGGDEDHAVGGPRAVDGRRSSVLENFDRLDIREVQHRERTEILAETVQRSGLVVERDAVDDIERFVAGAQRTRTADADALRRAEVTRRSRDRNTGHTSLKQFRGTQRRAHVVLVGFELTDGIGDHRAALGTVTHDDDIVDHTAVGNQHDAQFRCGVGNGDLLGLHAHERDLQYGIGLRGLEPECAVDP